MNILFLTIGRFEDIESHSIYPDLLRAFRDKGHSVYIVSAREKRQGLPTTCKQESGVTMLRVRIGNITKCGLIEKGISTIGIEKKYKKAINKYLSNVKFDLILYSTPPITLEGVVNTIKKRDGAITWLLLKDIFPQNAVDLELIQTSGLSGIVYKYFRNKEKKLYSISDYIGCMSQANVDYLLKHNPEILGKDVLVCPNCIEPIDVNVTEDEARELRKKYNIPINKKVFVYGGNLGKPQAIPFLIECLRTQRENEDAFFLIVGDGTDYIKLEEFITKDKQSNVKLLKRLPKDEYDKMIAACDVGMIFLDYRFTIPNFPSRLLSYMQAGIPILACTDRNTDIGQVIVDAKIGWWCESNNSNNFDFLVSTIVKQDLNNISKRSRKYLVTNYNVIDICQNMIDFIQQKKQRL